MPRGKAGPKPGPVLSKEEKAAAKAAKAEASALAKAAKEKERADAKVEKEAEKARKAAERAENKAVKAGAAGIGHNSGLTDDQQRALFVQNLTKIERLKEAMASASGELRAAYKTAKADGFAKKDIDYAIALRKDEDDKLIDSRRRETMIARWMNHPIGTQPDLFDGVDRTPSEDRAFEDGKLAGMEGKICQPPHDPSVPQHGRWLEGWHAGQAALIRDTIKRGPDSASDDAQASFDDAMPDGDDFMSDVPDYEVARARRESGEELEAAH